jgi:hypothetical protein
MKGNFIFWVIVALALIYILATATGIIGPQSALPNIQGEF